MNVRSRAVPLALGALLLGVAALIVVFGVLPALARKKALADRTAERVAEVPRVVFVSATGVTDAMRSTLPARLQAAQETALYPQVGGYLASKQVEMGDHVQAGQVLAEVDVPLIDRQLEQNESARLMAQAKIDLAQSRLDLAKATLARLRSVGDARAISQQAIDEASANEKADIAGLAEARAMLAAADADGRKLASEKALARIVAPFDGEITERNYDTGALLVAARTEGSKPLFRVSRRDEIRVFVNVPEMLAVSVQPGVPMQVRVKELPGRVFAAPIVRVSPVLEGGSRTRLVEARIPNADATLLPGMFAEAVLELPRAKPAVMVPGEAIVIRDGKSTLAVIDASDTLHYVPVQVGRDTGTMVEIPDGLVAGARVAVNLSRQLPDGTKVQAVPRPDK
jgi:RND family efflux transporter MFP subunit